MGYIEYGDPDNELNTYLRAHDMGHPGGLDSLSDMIGHVRVLAPLWWEYTGATLGSIRLKGGFMGDALCPLIDTPSLFTNCATSGLEALRSLLAQDGTRRAAYGEDHVDLLTLGFAFTTRQITEAADSCRFIDGSGRHVAADTTVAMLHIDHTPVWTNPDGFGRHGSYDTKTRTTTRLPPEQAEAMQAGWKTAATA